MSGPGGPRSGKTRSSLARSVSRHLDDRPWVGKLADRAVDQHRATPRDAARDCGAEFRRRLHPFRRDAEALGQLDEIRIAQVAGDGAVVEGLLLDALDVAVGAVAEHDRDDADAVL